MDAWYETLDGLRDGAWRALGDGVRDEAAPMRRVVLATLGRSGGPETRIVALRRADAAAGVVAVHTDTRSVKWDELAACPRVSLLAWDPDPQLQIRLRGTAARTDGAAVAADWAAVPPGSRGSYGVTPAPGTPIAAAGAYDRRPDPARFGVLTVTVAEIDVVLLSLDFHRRASFARTDGWRGTWLAP